MNTLSIIIAIITVLLGALSIYVVFKANSIAGEWKGEGEDEGWDENSYT